MNNATNQSIILSTDQYLTLVSGYLVDHIFISDMENWVLTTFGAIMASTVLSSGERYCKLEFHTTEEAVMFKIAHLDAI